MGQKQIQDTVRFLSFRSHIKLAPYVTEWDWTSRILSLLLICSVDTPHARQQKQ